MDADYLAWALADFSGYIAADELYDGPFCVLSIVDNRTFKRLLYQVLDHDPDHTRPPAGTCGAITAFLFRTPPSKTGWRPKYLRQCVQRCWE
jgi:hypothetical protein